MDVHFVLALFHIFIVVPFFFYIFYNRSATPDFVYNILFFVGLFLLVYQTIKTVIKYSANSASTWVNLIHVVIIAPLIIYIGYQAKKTPRPAYEMLGLITFSALGYHMYNLILLTNIIHSDN